MGAVHCGRLDHINHGMLSTYFHQVSRGERRERNQIERMLNTKVEEHQMKNILGEIIQVDDTPPNVLITECEAEYGAEVS